MAADKVRENRARRAIERRGYHLMKSRRRDTRAIDYGGYMIIDPIINGVVAGTSPAHQHGFSMSLEDVEQWLQRE